MMTSVTVRLIDYWLTARDVVGMGWSELVVVILMMMIMMN